MSRCKLNPCSDPAFCKPPSQSDAAGEWGRSILATAEASIEHGSFGASWRDYVASTEFNKLPEHDRALIRVAFVSGWRARGTANG